MKPLLHKQNATTDFYQQNCYKEIIKIRISELRQRKKPWTFKKIAHQLNIQSTYLSKVMNDQNLHLSEGDVFRVSQWLDFMPEEIEFILALRALQSSREPQYKNYLQFKIDQLKKDKKLDAQVMSTHSSLFTNQMDYLLQPLCSVVLIALTSSHLRKNTRRIGQLLGLDTGQLRNILEILERNFFIETASLDPYNVIKVKSRRSHFPKEHPLMRVHQQLLRSLVSARLQSTPEEFRINQMFTFTLDSFQFEKIKNEYSAFIKRVEVLSKQSTHQEVYQLNFDFFKWI